MKNISCPYCNAVYISYKPSCDKCGANLQIPLSLNGKSKLRIWIESLSSLGFIGLGLLIVVSILLCYQYIFKVNEVNNPIEQSNMLINKNQFKNYETRALLGNVFVFNRGYKIMILEYYYAKGEFPNSLDDLQQAFGRRGKLDTSKYVKSLEILDKGKLKIMLNTPFFRENSYILLTPRLINTGFTDVEWGCQTNLKQEEVGPESMGICTSIE